MQSRGVELTSFGLECVTYTLCSDVDRVDDAIALVEAMSSASFSAPDLAATVVVPNSATFITVSRVCTCSSHSALGQVVLSARARAVTVSVKSHDSHLVVIFSILSL